MEIFLPKVTLTCKELSFWGKSEVSPCAKSVEKAEMWMNVSQRSQVTTSVNYKKSWMLFLSTHYFLCLLNLVLRRMVCKHSNTLIYRPSLGLGWEQFPKRTLIKPVVHKRHATLCKPHIPHCYVYMELFKDKSFSEKESFGI